MQNHIKSRLGPWFPSLPPAKGAADRKRVCARRRLLVGVVERQRPRAARDMV